ncbi:MAG: sigma-70 family RNA polymerase sigma factor [Planctomycetia bacterium]|nr:sigma-70 family RNA polymerase sigma factor [Planctomycetia bacterium]
MDDLEVEHTSLSMTSPSLLLRAMHHDPAAWSRLSKIYGPLVYHWSRRCRLSTEDSADIVQETFGILARKIDTFRRDKQGDSFRGWLWTIARNRVRDHIRRSADRALATGGTTAHLLLQELAADAPEPVDDAQERTVTEQGVVARTLGLIQAEFETTTWQAFWSATVEKQTAAEIGAALGISKHAVHQAKYRVLRRLREEMDGLG